MLWSAALSRDDKGGRLTIGPPVGDRAVWQLADDASVLFVGSAADGPIPAVLTLDVIE